MRWKKYLLLSIIVILITSIYASYDLGSPKYELTDSYSIGEDIQGYLNMSLNQESATSIFSDSFGNSINLIELLKTNSNHNYTCNPSDCETHYTLSGGQTTKTINLNSNQEKIIGFDLNSDIDEITNFSLTISSDAQGQCENQLKIDLLNNGIEEIGNTKVAPEGICNGKNYGCFDLSEPTIQEVEMSSDYYCQKMNLIESPGFELGVWLKQISGSSNLKMQLYDPDLSEFVSECDLPAPNSQGGEVNCDVNYLITKKKNYYVCLYAQGTGTQHIKGYTKDKCGFNENPDAYPEETASFRIYAEPKPFDAIGTLEIKNNLQNGDFISDMISDYIYENYDNLSCDGRHCIIPIKLKSKAQQALTINGEIKYSDPFLGITQTSLLYDISETPAKINANKQKIYLDDAGFKVPSSEGNHTFKLNFNNQELFSKKINVKKGASILSINPTKTAVNLPTTFKVKIEDSQNISQYEWDFGDQETETSSEPWITHSYNSLGKYELKITLTNNLGVKSSKTFNITIGSAKEIIDSLITQKQGDLLNIKNQLIEFESFSAQAIKNILELEDIENKLTNISDKYSSLPENSNESKYSSLLLELIDINLPKSVNETGGRSLFLFFPKSENIDLDVISNIAGGSYDSSNYGEYQDAILGWNSENIQMKIATKKFSYKDDFTEGFLLKTIKIQIDDLGAQENPYIFIKELSKIGFKNNKSYSSGYYYKDLSGSEVVEFYTNEDIKFEDIPAFVSPSLDALVLTGEVKSAGKNFKWGLFFIIILILILIGFAVYYILKKWYATKYENYLFKDKNDLYNMVTYIQNSKLEGMNNEEIEKNLKKVGWNNEKINYVMKKYSGKETGLPSLIKIAPKKPVQKKKIVKKKSLNKRKS